MQSPTRLYGSGSAVQTIDKTPSKLTEKGFDFYRKSERAIDSLSVHSKYPIETTRVTSTLARSRSGERVTWQSPLKQSALVENFKSII